MRLNQYHHKSLGNPFQNGVGRVLVTFATFHLSCYNVMENPHSYILKTHATIASSSSSINTLGGPIFMLLIFPYRWSKSEVTGMPHNLLALHKEVMLLSIASMAASNDSLNHLPFGFIVGTLLVLVDLCIMFDILRRDILFVRFLLVQNPILFPTSDIKHHDALDFPRPNL
jgi:hypothetical protein